MTVPEIQQKVIAIVAQKFSVDAVKINGETRLAEDLGVDSFGAVELMFELEEAFNLKIEDSEIARVRTVNDIVAYLVSWLDKQNPPTT
ncbi:MAG TPA: acyl carrier protein [Lacunisphaera sp.]